MKPKTTESFQQWLAEISWSTLKESLQFELDDCEQNMFQEMVKLQAPPPTPIHPRAIPYATRCEAEASDGRDPVAKRRKDIRYRQRWFRLVQTNEKDIVVQAKNFEGDASKRSLNKLTVGCTREQVDCDRTLQDGTVAVLGQRGSVSYRYRGRCDEILDDASRKQAFLRTIKVASRGHFASVPPESKRMWLDESQRWWFPLSMYLACRFELSLWDAYRRNTPLPVTPSIPFSSPHGLSEEVIWATVSLAVGRVVKENVLRQVDMTLILDTLLWRLLQCPTTKPFDAFRTTASARNVFKALQDVALEDMADIQLVQVKQSICNYVHEQLADKMAAQAAESLLKELADSTPIQGAEHSGRKKKSRKKKRGQATILHAAETGSIRELSPAHIHTEDGDDGMGESVHRRVVFDPLISETPTRQHNRNKVFVLSILDGLITGVFRQMELPVTPQHTATSALHACGKDQSLNRLAGQVDQLAPMSSKRPPCQTTPEALPQLVDAQPPATFLQPSITLRETGKPGGKDLVPVVPGSDSIQCDKAQQVSQLALEEPHGISDERSTNDMVWEISDATVGDWGRVQGFASREQSIFKELFPTYDAATTSSIVESKAAYPSAPGMPPEIDQKEGNDVDDKEGADYLCAVYDRSQVFDVVKLRPAAIRTKSSPSASASGLNIAEDSEHQHGATSRSISSATGVSAPAVILASRPLLASSAPIDLETARLKISRNASLRSATTRLPKSRDDHDINQQRRSTDALSTYRFVLVKSATAKAKDDTDIRASLTMRQRSGLRSHGTPSLRHLAARSLSKHAASAAGSECSPRPMSHVNFDNSRDSQDLCARSETLEFATEMDHWIDRRPSTTFDDEVGDDNGFGKEKDETTTITSAPSQHEPEEMTRLREERNAYRDLCLTLGAEVSKLTNLLASQRVSSASASSITSTRGPYQPNLAEPVFDPESVAHGFLPNRARTLAAMSDAGIRAEYESLASEDTAAFVRLGPGRPESDWSVDQASAAIQSMQFQLPTYVNRSRGFSEPLSRTGMQSRLAQDIWQFVDATHAQLRKQDAMRQNAVEKMVRLVNTLWPRAQVKLYGSHVTGVCLPSSDVDFIICLPAVHKKAVAVAPGVLEGRNAINESSQKLLYRKLKAEPWIDQRSVKLIERTLVPVIKLTTKEVKGRALQLDITFDAPGHHGLEAVDLVGQVIEEMPTIRPIVLVLKQFLITKSLLTAYTGGLSSYCLFLMVTRYLQEQPSTYGDVGALLIGFLDFFGNHFEPRTTGISVRRREYFSRPNYTASNMQPRPQHTSQAPPLWQTANHTSQGNGNTQFYRRNSFSDKGNAESTGHGQLMTMARPHQLHHGLSRQSQAPHVYLQDGRLTDNSPFEHRISSSFDPLFVVDPLNESNNVGRNAFRYLQVQRAFSDAHRALVAALEWEMPSSTDLDNESDYPLLKCLLQSEDMVFDL